MGRFQSFPADIQHVVDGFMVADAVIREGLNGTSPARQMGL